MDNINTTFPSAEDFNATYLSNKPIYSEDRPWGSFDVLYEDLHCKVKKIIVKPGERPSKQYHFQRDETWIIVFGVGKLYLNFTEDNVSAGQVVTIQREQVHTIENIGKTNLIFIEIQTGEYFGEDDIVRVDDKYGRL